MFEVFKSAPKITSITRTPVAPVTPPAEGLTRDLATKASQVLGYHTLKHQIENMENDFAARKEVAAAFHKLGIEPLNMKEVFAYKERRRKWTAANNPEETVNWRLRPLSNSTSWSHSSSDVYNHPVPAFALERALQLKAELPEAVFYVDSLEQTPRVVYDPFMVLNYKGRFWYIDVWDEPEFEGRRVV